jgi:hypothetical protein
MTEQTPEKTFDVLLRVLRGIEELRIHDTPMNDLALVYKEGHESALDNAMNIIRKEL